jgi:ankyrin repeat protein
MNNGSVRNTPLYNAVSTGQFHVARVLIRAKADVNEDRKGTSLLERAMKTGNHAIAELLRNAGAQEAQEFKVE